MPGAEGASPEVCVAEKQEARQSGCEGNTGPWFLAIHEFLEAKAQGAEPLQAQEVHGSEVGALGRKPEAREGRVTPLRGAAAAGLLARRGIQRMLSQVQRLSERRERAALGSFSYPEIHWLVGGHHWARPARAARVLPCLTGHFTLRKGKAARESAALDLPLTNRVEMAGLRWRGCLRLCHLGVSSSQEG